MAEPAIKADDDNEPNPSSVHVMSAVDELPPELRALVYEYDFKPVCRRLPKKWLTGPCFLLVDGNELSISSVRKCWQLNLDEGVNVKELAKQLAHDRQENERMSRRMVELERERAELERKMCEDQEKRAREMEARAQKWKDEDAKDMKISFSKVLSRAATTYFDQAQGIDDEMGGRFAKVHTTTVVGSSSVSYPAQPSTSPWHRDPVPDEPPLGYSVDAVEPVGEIHERGPPSIAAAPAVEDGGGGPSDRDVSATSSNRPLRRGLRRI
jgi:DNA-binding transcriptional MerR regulator